jgi:hypothetical protein
MDSSPLGKPCPTGKIRHPKTGKCRKDKPCPPGKIRNPKTFRCVTDISTAGRFINTNAKLLKLLGLVSRTMSKVKVGDQLLSSFKLDKLSADLVVKNKTAAKRLVQRMSMVTKKIALKKVGKKLSVHLLAKDETKSAKVLDLAELEAMVDKGLKKLTTATGDDRKDLKSLLNAVFTIIGGIAVHGLNMYHGAVILMDKKFQAGLKKIDVTGMPKNTAASLKPEVVSALYDIRGKISTVLEGLQSVPQSEQLAKSIKAMVSVLGADKGPTTEELAFGTAKAEEASELLKSLSSHSTESMASAVTAQEPSPSHSTESTASAVTAQEPSSSDSSPKLVRLRRRNNKKNIED